MPTDLLGFKRALVSLAAILRTLNRPSLDYDLRGLLEKTSRNLDDISKLLPDGVPFDIPFSLPYTEPK